MAGCRVTHRYQHPIANGTSTMAGSSNVIFQISRLLILAGRSLCAAVNPEYDQRCKDRDQPHGNYLDDFPAALGVIISNYRAGSHHIHTHQNGDDSGNDGNIHAAPLLDSLGGPGVLAVHYFHRRVSAFIGSCVITWTEFPRRAPASPPTSRNRTAVPCAPAARGRRPTPVSTPRRAPSSAGSPGRCLSRP